MENTSEKPGADATGLLEVISDGHRNSAQRSDSVPCAQRTVSEEMERARSALPYIDPHDHDTWLRVGMALKDEFGDDAWPLFDEWCLIAENYAARANRSRWNSFRSGGGIAIATMYRIAGDAGWRDEGTFRIPEPEELVARREARAEAEARNRWERENAASKAAKRSSAIWSFADRATADNPYCRYKRIEPPETARDIDIAEVERVVGYVPTGKGGKLQGRLLVIPVKFGDKISSVQLIDGDSRKHFLAGGTIGGGYWAAQPLPDGTGAGITVLLGEGVATVLSARESVSTALGVAALSNTNMPAVARYMRKRYPAATIIVLADLHKITAQPDKCAAEAAGTVDGKLAVPRFADGPAVDRKDFNDMARLHGTDAVRAAIEAADPTSRPNGAAMKTDRRPKATVDLVLASTIKPEPISWLWPGHLARGKVHILGGKPAAGKTTLAICMAATVSTGGAWPDGTRCKPGHVVIWSGEDDPGDTLVPRLHAAGADLERVHFVAGATQDREPVPFDPATHMPALCVALGGLKDVALLIVDPVVSAVGGDSYKNAEVRRALQPLANLGAEADCAVLGITHFTKGTSGSDPVERLTGSLAFGAVARIVLVAAKAEDSAQDREGVSNEGRRLLMRAKSNIGPDGGGFEYDLEQRLLPDYPGITATAVKWGGAVEGSARQLLAEAEATDGEDGDSVSDAMDWLRQLLADGPVEQPTIKTKAKAAGHAWATVRRAQKRLDIRPRKQGMKGGWSWELHRRCSQFTEDAPLKMESTFDNHEHLRAGREPDDDVEGVI